MVLNNYQPVSTLCTVSKIFERVMRSRLLHSFLEEQKVQKTVRIQTSFMALMVMVDFSKAFDTVNGAILLEKLWNTG